jgi:hypothetical protein
LQDGNVKGNTMPMIPPKKPTPVRDARTHVQNERSQLADAREKLMLAKQAQQRMMADKVAKQAANKQEQERMMADKVAKQVANKPPPVLPTPRPPPMRPTTPMPDRPMPMPPPMSGGPTKNIFKTVQDAVRSGATQSIPKAVQGAVNKMPTSSGGVMGGVTNAVQGAVNKMPTPVQNVIQPPGMKRGGAVGSASKRGDGIAQRGKTKGRYL